VLSGMIKVWGALGGSAIDFRAPDERTEETPRQKRTEELLVPGAKAEKRNLDPSILPNTLNRLLNFFHAAPPLSPEEAETFESLHVLAICDLVVQAKDARPFFSLQGSNLTLPSAHLTALRFIDDCRAASKGPLSGNLKWIPKKLGLNSIIASLRDPAAVGPTLRSDRELQALCRDVERALSETLALVGTYKMLVDDETRADYLSAMRPILEHTPSKFRHRSVLAVAGCFRRSAGAGGVLHAPLPSVSSGWSPLQPLGGGGGVSGCRGGTRADTHNGTRRPRC